MVESRVALKGLTVYLESNPNPNALKFVADRLILPEGMIFDFPSPESATHAPLARELFTYPFVAHVLYTSYFITINKHSFVDWIEVQEVLRIHIRNFIESGKALLTKTTDPPASGIFEANEEETIRAIREVIENYVKPAVELDGGSIVFHSFHSGELTVELRGACRGCPAASQTLQQGVARILEQALPGVVHTVRSR